MIPVRRLSHPSPKRQRGAALLTAMIIVTLVSTLASAMVWQQWRAVQVESSERARTQAAWILSGALDFAKLILREDAKTGRPTALTEPWATPLAEARLSTFLAVDKANADDGPEAFLSGNIDDAQARYNLNNLVLATNVKAELEVFTRVCEAAGLDSSVASRIATGLSRSSTTATGAPSGSAPLKPMTVDQLTWLGVDVASVQALKPFVVLLPGLTGLNVNTASSEVLAAVLGVDPATAVNITKMRQQKAFISPTDFSSRMSITAPGAGGTSLAAQSNFFEVRGRLRLVDRVLVERSLVQRDTATRQVTVLHRERVSSLEQAGA